MRKIEIRVESLQDGLNKFIDTFNKIKEGKKIKKEKYISVSSIEELNKLLSPQRLKLLNFLRSNKVSSIKELSNKLNRDYKNVYSDLKLFEGIGLVRLKRNKRQIVPEILYDEIDIKIPLGNTV